MKNIGLLLLSAMAMTVSSSSLVQAQPPYSMPRHVEGKELPQASPAAIATFDALTTAIIAENFDGFVALLDDDFKKILTRKLFEEVCAYHTSRFKSGCEVLYLGEVKQRGMTISIWKMSFADGGDQTLATLSLQDGKVAGFYLG